MSILPPPQFYVPPSYRRFTISPAVYRKYRKSGQHTVFRLRARLDDGYSVWTGWFGDEDDAEAFLYAIATDTLCSQPDLWRLPTPQWHPDLGEHLSYEFATLTFITATGAGTFTVPNQWNANFNSIGCLGGGGGGAGGKTNQAQGGGGGGGAYSEIENVVLAPGAVIDLSVGVGGAAGPAGGNGTNGGDTFFGATTFASALVGAKAGQGSVTVMPNDTPGGPGGLASAGIGTTKHSGGTGASNGGNGGGAAGIHGDGNSGTSGGNGDAGFGGIGGTTPSAPGGAGTEWDATHGSGGGGAPAANTSAAGVGGLYGAGGGAGYATASSQGPAGAGRQGLIVITNSPFVFGGIVMLGM